MASQVVGRTWLSSSLFTEWILHHLNLRHCACNTVVYAVKTSSHYKLARICSLTTWNREAFSNDITCSKSHLLLPYWLKLRCESKNAVGGLMYIFMAKSLSVFQEIHTDPFPSSVK